MLSTNDVRDVLPLPGQRAGDGQRGVGEEKGHLNYSFLKRAWLLLGVLCACKRAPREKEESEREKKKRVTAPAKSSSFLIYYPSNRVARRWLQEAKRDAFFSSLNRTQLLLRLSVSRSFFETHAHRHKLRQNLIGRFFVGAQCT